MTIDEDENILQKKPKLLKRKIIKKSYDVLTPDDYFMPHYPHNPDNQITHYSPVPQKHYPHQYNDSLTPNTHITHTHAITHENVIVNPPPTMTPSMTNSTTTTTTATTTRPRIKRVFGGIFGSGTTALIESALKVSIPIPFCQAPGSPCKRRIIV